MVRSAVAASLAHGERLRRLAFVVVALVACVGLIGPFRGFVSIRASVEVLARASASAARAAKIPSGSEQCRKFGARPLDLKTILADVDEDDSPCEARPDAALACGDGGWPRSEGRPPRRDLPVDTSRYACGPALPRGPPV